MQMATVNTKGEKCPMCGRPELYKRGNYMECLGCGNTQPSKDDQK